ncbi:MAG: PQQ-binding-like beta-propeller repeat protein [Verrucomicrobia bacterium]|nr:PQQ-binding-like beta-propeller repeat protein [Verrucomicrobiota bacterium]
MKPLAPLLLTSCLTVGLLNGQNWPQAGGPNGTFIVESGNAPTQWSVALDQQIAWKVTLPELGQSSVTVWQDKLFFTINKPVREDTVLAKDVVAYCCSAVDGSILWTREIPGIYPLKIGTSWGDSSGLPAVTDGKQVAFFNASGAIESYDMKGNRIWRREALSSYRGSPFLIDNKLIYMQMNWPPDDKGGYPHPEGELPFSNWTQVQAVDFKTGKPIWSTACGGNIGSVPMPLTLDDGRKVFLVGRGGGHEPPEKPLGVSLVDARDGSEIWKLPIENYQCRQTKPLYKGHALILHDDEHWWVDLDSGKVSRKVSLTENVTVRMKEGNHWVKKSMTLETSSPAAETTDQSNLLVGNYHYFRSYLYNFLGRVNVETGEVEYLQLPVSLLRKPNKPDRFIWNESDLKSKPEKTFNVRTETSYWNFKTNSIVDTRGFKLLGDARSQGNGWGHVAAQIPTAIGKNLYVPIMNGMVYVIDWNAAVLDENALLSINDLGPLGQAFNRSNITYSDGRLYAQTIRELICIGK